MTAREYLTQAKTLNARIMRQMYRRDELYALMTCRTAKLSKMPGGGRNDRSLEDTMTKYVLLEEEINRQIDALVDLKEEIRSVIEQLPDDTEKNVLEMFYLENKTMKEIGEELLLGNLKKESDNVDGVCSNIAVGTVSPVKGISMAAVFGIGPGIEQTPVVLEIEVGPAQVLFFIGGGIAALPYRLDVLLENHPHILLPFRGNRLLGWDHKEGKVLVGIGESGFQDVLIVIRNAGIHKGGRADIDVRIFKRDGLQVIAAEEGVFGNADHFGLGIQ